MANPFEIGDRVMVKRTIRMANGDGWTLKRQRGTVLNNYQARRVVVELDTGRIVNLPVRHLLKLETVNHA